MVMVKASMLPSTVTSAITTQTLANPYSSSAAINTADAEAANVPICSRARRDHLSAIAPDSIPSTKKGSMRAPAPTPHHELRTGQLEDQPSDRNLLHSRGQGVEGRRCPEQAKIPYAEGGRPVPHAFTGPE